MTAFLRRFSIRSRLIALAAAPLALVAIVSLVAVVGFTSDTKATAEVARSADISSDAASLQYQAADYNGWQTAYAFDVIRGVKGAAEDTADSRKAFLASGSLIDEDIARLDANTDLTAEEQALVAKAKTALKAFADVDVQVDALYKEGTPASIQKANDLVLGAEIKNYNDAAAAMASMVKVANEQLAADVQAASDNAARNKMITIVVLLLGIVLVGVFVVIALFAFLIYRAFMVGREAMMREKYFAALVAQGIGVWLSVQAFINMGVNMGLLPTKGLTLPFLSYGGSGIIVNCLAVAVLLRIDAENRSTSTAARGVRRG